jgi:hypothetical protein
MCDPEAEAHYREYRGLDPDGCAAADPEPCPEYTTHFGNECGCGCEQGVECPDTYACPADGSMMRCEYLRIHCPFTELTVP